MHAPDHFRTFWQGLQNGGFGAGVADRSPPGHAAKVRQYITAGTGTDQPFLPRSANTESPRESFSELSQKSPDLQEEFSYNAETQKTLCKNGETLLGKCHLLIFKSCLTLPMLRLLLSEAHGRKDFCKPSKPRHVGTHWIVLTEYSYMSTHLPGFQSFFRFFSSFCIRQISHQQHKG